MLLFLFRVKTTFPFSTSRTLVWTAEKLPTAVKLRIHIQEQGSFTTVSFWHRCLTFLGDTCVWTRMAHKDLRRKDYGICALKPESERLDFKVHDSVQKFLVVSWVSDIANPSSKGKGKFGSKRNWSRKAS